MESKFRRVTELRSSKSSKLHTEINLCCVTLCQIFLSSPFSSIRQTHELDPAVEVPDGSHMDIVQGFKPERWLNESTKPTEYMPFGYGPRYVMFLRLSIQKPVVLVIFSLNSSVSYFHFDPFPSISEYQVFVLGTIWLWQR